MPKPLDPLVKLARENERLKIDNANIRALNKKLLRRGGGYDELIEEMRRVVEGDRAFVSKYSPSPLPSSVLDPKHEEIACVAVSDLHLSEVVKEDDTNGINCYNSIVAANRLWLHAQKVKSILRRHQTMYKFRMLWSPLLGDIINGSIHPEMIYTNDLSDAGAVVLATRLLYMFYGELKTLGIPIEIDTAVGNHPRTTVKMPSKRQATTNLDWMVYQGLADRFEGDDQVRLRITTAQIGMRKLFNWNMVFEHGIDVRHGKEDDLENRIRALFDDPTYRAATGYTGPAFDHLVIGNLHRPTFYERLTVNGAYTAQNELGMSWRLKPIKAIQAMWGCSKKHCRTWLYPVDMTEMRSQKPENQFSEYAAWFVKKYGH